MISWFKGSHVFEGTFSAPNGGSFKIMAFRSGLLSGSNPCNWKIACAFSLMLTSKSRACGGKLTGTIDVVTWNVDPIKCLSASKKIKEIINYNNYYPTARRKTKRRHTENLHVMNRVWFQVHLCQINGTSHLNVNTAQITSGQLPIDKHPQIIITDKRENFDARVEERNLDLSRKPIIILQINLPIQKAVTIQHFPNISLAVDGKKLVVCILI